MPDSAIISRHCVFVRNLGLMAAERAGVLKRQALKYALGL